MKGFLPKLKRTNTDDSSQIPLAMAPPNGKIIKKISQDKLMKHSVSGQGDPPKLQLNPSRSKRLEQFKQLLNDSDDVDLVIQNLFNCTKGPFPKERRKKSHQKL
jgi:hypothetical protein